MIDTDVFIRIFRGEALQNVSALGIDTSPFILTCGLLTPEYFLPEVFHVSY